MFDAAPTLTGSTVRLEPLTLEHVPGLCAVGLDPELWRWTTSLVDDAGEMERYVQVALRAQESGSAIPFATIELASGRVVGSTRFAAIARPFRRVEIGWTWVARPWQRTAVNTEAKYLMLRHAFEVEGCIRVEFKTDVLNQASRNALQRIGAREEGVLRDHVITATGRVRDTIYFSILAREWPDVKAMLERRLAMPPSR
ncbi:MAG TPA: GNAT family protein [Longimicrobiales bacterium]|nr:GNAT family protein [Longimicrobiales bacterium]